MQGTVFNPEYAKSVTKDAFIAHFKSFGLFDDVDLSAEYDAIVGVKSDRKSKLDDKTEEK